VSSATGRYPRLRVTFRMVRVLGMSFCPVLDIREDSWQIGFMATEGASGMYALLAQRVINSHYSRNDMRLSQRINDRGIGRLPGLYM
jgi:hypothetical protein